MENQDFGAGITVDDLIGLRAVDILRIRIPEGALWLSLRQAAARVVDAGYEDYVLTEVWGDGHSVWYALQGDDLIQMKPDGQISRGG